MRILRLAFLVVLLTSCRTMPSDLPAGRLLNIDESRVIFQRPECLPNCTSSDQAALTEKSEIERAYITAIRGAKKSVEFSQFTFSRKPIFEALIEAAAKGVAVRGIMDRAQLKTTLQFCQNNVCKYPGPFNNDSYITADIAGRVMIAQSEDIYKNGTNSDKLALLFAGRPDGSGLRTAPGKERLVHNKFAIIDRDEILTGSGNWSSTAVSVNLENLTRFKAPADLDTLKAYTCMFDLVWTGNPDLIAKDINGCQIPGKILFSPAARQGPQDFILQAVDTAKEKIDISMHHLVDPDTIQSLLKAKLRGVTVRVAVDDDDCNMKENSLKALEEQGIEVKYLPTTCKIFQLSHSKFGIFDRAVVINGSGNWSTSGLSRNYENFFQSQELASEFVDQFEWLWSKGQNKAECQCDVTTPECIAKYCLNQEQ